MTILNTMGNSSGSHSRPGTWTSPNSDYALNPKKPGVAAIVGI